MNVEQDKAPIIELEDYTDKQKIEFFDELYDMSREYLARAQEGNTHDDEDHWFFEKGIEVLNLNNTREVWDYINQLD